jgi:Curli production assembly/transport component CsgG
MGSKDRRPQAQAPRKFSFWTFCTANGELLLTFIAYVGNLGSSIEWIINFAKRLHANPSPVSSFEKTQDTVINQPPQTLIAATQSFLVLPFDNASNSVPRGLHKETAYLQTARTSLEQLINFLGGKLVERAKLDALLMELEFQRSSGLSDESKAIQFGQMTGARFIVFGSLDDAAISEVRTTTYQTETTKHTYSIVLSVRVVDIKTSNIEYNRTVTESYSEVWTRFVSSDTQDHFPQLIRKAIAQLSEDSTFARLIRTGG